MYYPDVLRTMGRIRYVVGKVEGPLNLAPDEKVVFVGDCTSWQGTIDGNPVKIESNYRTTTEVDAHHTKSNDMILKIFGPLVNCFLNRSSRYFHAKGCPVSVGSHVNYLSSIAKIKNVNFDTRNLVPINVAYWQMRLYAGFEQVSGVISVLRRDDRVLAGRNSARTLKRVSLIDAQDETMSRAYLRLQGCKVVPSL